MRSELRHHRLVPLGALARLLFLLVVFSASGATCQRSLVTNPFGTPGPIAPEVLAEGASREQIIAAVNQNSAKIQSLSVTGASITIPDVFGLPLLNGNIAAERPGRFRLTAGTSITGQEIDLGSNDELFWMWARRNQPPAVYSCRHDQFANSAIRQMMPVEPAWLLAALGMVELNPTQVFDGPLPRGDGTVELRSHMPSVAGTLQRVTVIDARRAWVVEQHVYDQTGTTLLASAVAESHRYYPVEQVSLPGRISLRLPSANLAMTIDLGSVQINQLAGDRQQLFSLPSFQGYPQHDLGGTPVAMPIPGRPIASPAASGVAPTAYPPYPSTAYPGATAPYSAPDQGGKPNSLVPASSMNYSPLPRYGDRNSRTLR